MARYALLLKANANRVFGESSFALARAELTALAASLGGGLREAERATIGGVDYVLVDAAGRLDDEQVRGLSNLSSLHALYEVDDVGRFLPVSIAPRQVLDDDLVTIQRYAGQDERGLHPSPRQPGAVGRGRTAMARWLDGERLRLIDPACGRGTSLNRAALYGMDACGIDIDLRDVDAYRVFFTTWLKDKRLKHTVERARLRKGRAEPAQRVTITYGRGPGGGLPTRGRRRGRRHGASPRPLRRSVDGPARV